MNPVALPQEPTPTAVALVTVAILLAAAALLSRVSGRTGFPLALVFLGVGMLAGERGLLGLPFSDYELTFQIGTIALCLILFDGGMNTPLPHMRAQLAPSAMLATLGVVLTAATLAGFASLLGVPGPLALLIGAVVSSTDAAAVFAALRGSGLHLKKRVGMTLEMESGLNDPMAFILTVQITKAVLTGQPLTWRLAAEVVVELVVGAVVGIAVGKAGAFVLRRATLSAGGLYPVLTVSIAFLAFGASSLLHGSGFIAVYLAAVFLGNEKIPYRGGIARVHDAIAWFCQVGMFLLLGLLSDPLRLLEVAPIGLLLGAGLSFVARPLAVLLCLVGFKWSWKERLYVAWTGLRGPVPIIFATYPVMAGVPGSLLMFDVVFFIVVVSAILPGATIGALTKRVGLASNAAPTAPALLEVTSTKLLRGNVIAFFVDKASAVSGVQISDLPFPGGAAVMLIVREDELIAPRGGVVLEPGDHIYVITRPEDEPLVNLMFGKREEMD